MRYIPAKVVFDDLETTYLKDYMQQWDADGEKRKAIDAATEFDICTVRENERKHERLPHRLWRRRGFVRVV